MKIFILIFLGLLNFKQVLAKGSPAITNSKSCINYDEPQEIHSSHYWDGKIHLVPMFGSGGISFKGFVIVHLPKNSPYIDQGFLVGDIITQIDDIFPKADPDKKVNEKFFEKLKSTKFKSVKIERCQNIEIQI